MTTQEWICTDPDMNQRGRKIGDRTYEFKQDMEYPDGSVVNEELTIDLNLYSDEQIQDHLSTFGYNRSEMLKEWGEEQTEWLIAECIFENESF